ncbi:hypothetical protein Y919_08895 [Caloranaerobacter azorensis H53214]|uniref:Bacterial toxin 24 domain-containing protein n=1 Tax=Caloranaerobacter azorensis H53214 TaxID=1156417 RepID=A0A096CTS8_9FIRM|nr:hypothetical protein [Caloranaerobacter azorensis]KGG79954.1 hypothetical protein Y919_08895 [Caloranaerobacter azorensis H53214]
MNKYMKKISLVLVLTVLFTALPLDAFASEEVDPVKVPHLGTIKIIAGEIQIDPESKLTEMVYDENECLEKVISESGYEFFFKYDEKGTLEIIVDNKGNLTELKYNDNGELVDAEYKTYVVATNDSGETEIYTEGQDGEFAFVLAAPIVVPAAVETIAAVTATAAAAYATGKAINYAKKKIKEKKKVKAPTSSDRLRGKPNSINKDGYAETKIGPDGRAIKERHHTDHGNPKYHTNPHDHEIKWENGKPRFGPPINNPGEF